MKFRFLNIESAICVRILFLKREMRRFYRHGRYLGEFRESELVIHEND